MALRLSTYYAIYRQLGSSRNRYYAIRLARALGLRHLVVRFDTNFVCNLKCQTCYFSGPEIKPMMRVAMSEDQFRKVAKEVFPDTRILFLSCGAEPLMTKSFDKFLDITSEYRVPYVGFTTNGLLFKPETVDAVMRNKVSEIIISVDGASAKTYEYIRRGGKFDVLLEKLQLLVDAKAKHGSDQPALRFNYTVCRSNFRETLDIIELAKRFGVATVKIRHFTDWGGAFKFHDESLQGHEQEFNALLLEAWRRTKSYGIKFYAPEPFVAPRGARQPVSTVADLIDETPFPPCALPWYHLYISPEGYTRPCTYLPVGRHSLFDHTLAQIEDLKENSERRRLLLKEPAKSCLGTVCNGQILRRADEDSNNLAQYDEKGLVDDSLRLHQPAGTAEPNRTPSGV